MHVPFFKQPDHGLQYGQGLRDALEKTIRHGQFILGPEVDEFERRFASFLGARECIGVSTGCDALFLTLKAIGVGNGDEIIVPANTFIGTILPVLQVGAVPVFVDCSPDDSNIDPALIEEAITSKTRVIVPVHLYGRPARMDRILALASDHNLVVIEDAAQAHGAKFKGKRCGSIAPFSTFSFYPAKNLGAYGDAGAVVTSNDQVALAIRQLRNYGQSKKYHHDYDGWNSRLDTLQAGILLEKLVRLDEENAARRSHAAIYHEHLRDLPLRWPRDATQTEPVYHLFVVMTEYRDRLAAYLNERGIQTGIHYPIPCHRQKCISGLASASGSYPECERQAQEVLSLPMYSGMRKVEIEYITDTVRHFFSQKVH